MLKATSDDRPSGEAIAGLTPVTFAVRLSAAVRSATAPARSVAARFCTMAISPAGRTGKPACSMMRSARCESPCPWSTPDAWRVPNCPLRTVTPTTKAIQPRIASVRCRALHSAARAAIPFTFSLSVIGRTP